ncbi:MAG TPA: hypothetical protein VLJ10_04855, partial [Candidatus Bathyarchaeia archaeon]|nr:hypothetical protein [Candidatus Bathyarchaeia archaeon]
MKKFLFIIFTIILVYLGCEIGSALIYALTIKTTPPPAAPSKINDASKETFFNDVVIHPYTGFNFLEGTLFRYSNIIPKRKPNQVIIGMTGGSVAGIFYAFRRNALAERLKQTPFFHGKEIVFVGLAIAGAKQPQQLFLLTNALTYGAEFDILINIDGFNELALPAAENIPQHIHPLFPRRWNLLIKIKSFDKDTAALQFVGKIALYKEWRRRWNLLFDDSLLRFSMTMRLTQYAGDNILENLLTRGRIDLDRYKESQTESFGPPFSFTNKTQLYQTLVQYWKHHSKMLGDLCRANGIEYFHFLQPNQYLKNSKTFSPEELKIAFDENHPYREPIEQGYPYLRTAGNELQEEGELFFDLSMI